MKILAVMGSPKGKGAGYKIIRKIEEGMKMMGDVEFKYLFLKDINLKQCTGCYNCLAKGEDKCPLKDDRASIEQELLSADGIILSTPVYVLNVSWLMKNFIDRFAYTNHRPRFHRLKVLSVVNMGGDSPKAALSFLRNALGGSRIVHSWGSRLRRGCRHNARSKRRNVPSMLPRKSSTKPVWTRLCHHLRFIAIQASSSGKSYTSHAVNLYRRIMRFIKVRSTILIRA